MRHVELKAVVRSETAEDVFDQVMRWDRYPDLAPHVESTTVHGHYPEPECESSWELHFRSGLLRWTESDHFERDRLRIRFEQTDGDFDSFAGSWHLIQEGDDVAVTFAADFDFGIPSLEGILDPIAERVILETIAWVLTGLFAATDILDDLEPSDTPETRSTAA